MSYTVTSPTPTRRDASRPPMLPSPANPIFTVLASGPLALWGRYPARVRYLVEPQPLVAFRADAPLAVVALAVGLVVVAIALDPGGPVRVEDVVEHRPNSGGLGRAQKRDLGHVAVMRGERIRERPRHEFEVLRVGLRRSVQLGGQVMDAVLGEQVLPGVPVFGVHQPEVPRLELLDLLNIPQLRGQVR